MVLGQSIKPADTSESIYIYLCETLKNISGGRRIFPKYVLFRKIFKISLSSLSIDC